MKRKLQIVIAGYFGLVVVLCLAFAIHNSISKPQAQVTNPINGITEANYVPNEIIIGYKKDLNPAKIKTIISTFKLKEKGMINADNIIYSYQSTLTPFQLGTKIKNSFPNDVDFADPNIKIHLEPFSGTTINQTSNQNGHLTGLTTTNLPKIAIIDSGVNYNHASFQSILNGRVPETCSQITTLQTLNGSVYRCDNSDITDTINRGTQIAYHLAAQVPNPLIFIKVPYTSNNDVNIIDYVKAFYYARQQGARTILLTINYPFGENSMPTAINTETLTPQHLLSVAGLDSSHVWAVGKFGTIIKYDGTTWKNEYIFDSGQTLNSIVAIDSSNVWAVGNQGTILKYDGTYWRAQSSPTTKDLYALSAINGQNVWAVGYEGTVIKYNGTAWDVVPQGVTNKNLYGVYGADSSNVWAVGYGGMIIKYNGLSWTQQSSPATKDLKGISGLNTSNVWAVGVNGTILKYNNSTWNLQTSPTTQELTSVHALDLTHLWAVGKISGQIPANPPILFSSNGGQNWSNQPNTINYNLNGIRAIDSQNIWSIGNSGTIVKYDGSTWSNQTAETDQRILLITEARNYGINDTIGRPGSINNNLLIASTIDEDNSLLQTTDEQSGYSTINSKQIDITDYGQVQTMDYDGNMVTSTRLAFSVAKAAIGAAKVLNNYQNLNRDQVIEYLEKSADHLPLNDNKCTIDNYFGYGAINPYRLDKFIQTTGCPDNCTGNFRVQIPIAPGWNMISFGYDSVKKCPGEFIADAKLGELPELPEGCLVRYDTPTLSYSQFDPFNPSEFGTISAKDGYWLNGNFQTSFSYTAYNWATPNHKMIL
jgi:hypothetical protein